MGSKTDTGRASAWCRRTLAVVVLAAATLGVLTVTLVTLVPSMMESLLQRRLRAAGFPDVSLEVYRASPKLLVVGALKLGSGEDVVAADTIAVRYRLPDLLRRRELEEIRVSGLRLYLSADEAGWRIAGLPPDIFADHGTGRLVIGRIAATSSLLLVRQEDHRFAIPFSAEMHSESTDEFTLTALLEPNGETIALTGTGNAATGDVVVHLNAQVVHLDRWRPWLSLIPADWSARIPSAYGEGVLDVTAGLENWNLTRLAGSFTLPKAQIQGAGFSSVLRDVASVLEIGPELAAPRLRVTADVESAKALGATTGGFSLTATSDDDGIVIETSQLSFSRGPSLRGHGALRCRLEEGGGCRFEGTLGSLSWRQLTLSETTVNVNGLGAALVELFSGDPGMGDGNAWEAAVQAAMLSHGGQRLGGGALHLSGAPGGFTYQLEAHGAEGSFGVVSAALQGSLKREPGAALTTQGRVMLNPRGLPAPMPGLTTAGTVTPIDLTAAFEQQNGTWHHRADLQADLREWQLVSAAPLATIHFGGRLEASVHGDSALSAVQLNATATDMNAVSGNGRLEVTKASLQLTADHLAVDQLLNALTAGRRASSRGQRPDFSLSGRLRIQGAKAGVDAARSCNAIDADLPFVWTLATGFEQARSLGRIHVGRSQWRDFEGSDLDAACWLDGDRLGSRGSIRLRGLPVPIEFEQTLSWHPELQSEARLHLASFDLGQATVWCRSLLQRPDLELGGRLGADAELSWTPSGATGRANLQLSNGTVRLQKPKLTIEGLTATLALSDVFEVRSEAHQSITFEQATVAGIPIDGGRLLYRLEPAKHVFLEEGRLNWCGGRLYIQATDINLATPNLQLLMFADAVEVDRVVNLLRGVEGTGKGTLYGKLPISFSEGRIAYGDGFLFNPPGESGALQLAQAGMLTGLAGGQPDRRQELDAAADALHDFQYSIFNLRFSGSGREAARLRLRIFGKPADNPQARPVDLNINVSGPLEDCINLGLRLSRGGNPLPKDE